MGHRHTFGTSQMFEIDNDPSWNYTEQPYVHLGTGIGDSESSSLAYPVENPSIDGTHFHSHWNNAPRPNAYASSSQTVELSHYQPESSNPFLHPSDYNPHASSSNYGGQSFHDGGFFDLTMGDGRAPYKRKSPGVPTACERGSTSRYHDAGSSSTLSLSSDKWPDRPNPDFRHPPWDYPTSTQNYRGNNINLNNNILSIGGEGTLRNVRSRAALDLEANLARTHLSSNRSHNSYTANHPVDHSTPMDLSTHSSNPSSWEWNHTLVSPPTHETNHLVTGRNNNLGSSLEIGGYNNNSIPSGNHIPQNLQGTISQSARGVRSSYSQRSHPTFGVGASSSSSSNMGIAHEANPDEGLQLAGSYSSRHSRPFSNVGWRNNDRSGRARLSSERYRMLSDEHDFHARLGPEGVMNVDRSNYYGSRNSYDQHRDMRLDVDDMSYEELLALGERIGSVNTGLSGDSISKCLTESIYCSSDRFQDEGTCVICLEEYENMDDVGMLRGCRHDFHVGCIRKWLSMKNVCPICKSTAMGDADHVVKNN